MATIKITAFSGEMPRLVPRLLPPSAARVAIDARLDDGALTPYRRSRLEESLDGGPFETIYYHDDEWLAWDAAVNAVPGPVAQDRLYYTGDGVPKMRVGEDVYNLKVPAPATAPTATASGSGTGIVQTRVYVYTFVTELGEESEPSPPSNEEEWQEGQTVELSELEAAPASPDRGISKQRFYRSQTGSVGTDLYFIAERDVVDTDFEDDIDVDAFAEPLPSRHYNPPPDELAGLISLPNGMMAAFRDKDLFFCEPWRPHAWPESYVLTTETPIVALAAMGTLVWVLTEGFPYRLTGTSPDSMVMEKVEAHLPCVNARAVVDLGHAVAWPSHDGLAAARPDGSVGLVSHNIFSPREWQQLIPTTMRAGFVNGRWIGSYEGGNQSVPDPGSIIIDMSGESFLIRTATRARHWHYDLASGNLFFLDIAGTNVMQFDSRHAAPASLYWRSKAFVLPRPENFGCILVESGIHVSQAELDARDEEIADIIDANEDLIADGPIGGELAGGLISETTLAGDILEPVPAAIGSSATVGIYADGERVATVTEFDRVARLPAGFRGRIWEIDVFSDITTDQITMATTVDELRQTSGSPAP